MGPWCGPLPSVKRSEALALVVHVISKGVCKGSYELWAHAGGTIGCTLELKYGGQPGCELRAADPRYQRKTSSLGFYCSYYSRSEIESAWTLIIVSVTHTGSSTVYLPGKPSSPKS